MGKVEIRGTVDVFQYWPHGASDVDTVKFRPDLSTAVFLADGVSVPVGAFFEVGGFFVDDEQHPGERAFKKILRSGNAFSVRLQGIDAPETHYSSNFREQFDGNYATWLAKLSCRQRSHRQPYGKLCTDMFAMGIRKALAIGEPAPGAKPTPTPVEAVLRIAADGINGAVDAFGRVVGEIALAANGQQVVLNDFALVKGFAFCSFYSSMTLAEMERLKALFASHPSSGAERSALRNNLSRHLRDFEPDLWTTLSVRDTDRDDNESNGFRAKTFDPKIFRRCVDWVGRVRALGETSLLLDYMLNNGEKVVLFPDLNAAGGNWGAAKSVTMGSLIGPDGSLLYEPGDVVFESLPVEVVDSSGNKLPATFTAPFP